MQSKHLRTDLYKIALFGQEGVGKSSLVTRLTWGDFKDTYDPTLEVSYRSAVIVDGERCMAEFLDTAGQEEYAALRDLWMKDCEGVLLLYSISSRETFETAQRIWGRLKEIKEQAMVWEGFPVTLLGNKNDLADERVVTTEEGKRLAEKLRCTFAECSVKDGVGHEEPVMNLLRAMKKAMLEKKQEGTKAGRTREKDEGDKELREEIEVQTRQKSLLKRVIYWLKN